MKPSRYDLDPDGDLVLVVEASATPDFLWNNDTLRMGFVEKESTIKKEADVENALLAMVRMSREISELKKPSKMKKNKKNKKKKDILAVEEPAEVLTAPVTCADELPTATEPQQPLLEELPFEDSPADVSLADEHRFGAASVDHAAIQDLRDIDTSTEAPPIGDGVDALPGEPKHAELHQDSGQPALAFGEDPTGKFRIRVSSGHLRLASPVFQKTLEEELTGLTPHGQLLREMQIPSWSIDALIIVLDIIHGHHREVPRSLSLELLTKVSMIASYYQFQEVIQVFAELWLNDLDKNLPQTHSKESILMLIVGSVFTRPDIFRKMCQLALSGSEGVIKARLGISIPMVERSFVQIESQREEALRQLFESIYNLLDSPHDSNLGCNFECSSMMLGSLLMEVDRNGLRNPRVTWPYSGHSISSIKRKISGFRRPIWSIGYGCSLNCTVQAKLQPTLIQVSKHIEELKLWEVLQE
ncbi:hypothetical protein B0J13DRAFT_59164 [Dactylonectria estremocensis]|uniref:BTB domain-containing protein n=1 Tax=Dactylonectria estremocensis TaxID=1079267 RepID=A0A9P9J309_9HYPO|nr:hypothetical protein B0J13DRAFT_59164 [Dactylonectria estremocensis]